MSKRRTARETAANIYGGKFILVLSATVENFVNYREITRKLNTPNSFTHRWIHFYPTLLISFSNIYSIVSRITNVRVAFYRILPAINFRFQMFKNRSKRDFVTVLLDEEKEETKINVIGRITCCPLRIFVLSAEQIFVVLYRCNSCTERAAG